MDTVKVTKEVKNIDQVIDMKIMDFVLYAGDLTITELKTHKNMMTQSLQELHQTRAGFELAVKGKLQFTDAEMKLSAPERAKIMSEEKQKSFNNYIATFVVEKSIADKMDILDHMIDNKRVTIE